MPTNIQELRSFFGLANQFRDLIIGFAPMVAPLNEILKGKSKRSAKKIKWTVNRREALKIADRQ